MDEEKDFSETSDNSHADDENKNAISADLIRGHINTIILRTLYERDKYGYEIIEEIERKSHGQYSLKQPTLYSALKRLESQGYINAYWKTDEVSLGGRRKYYTLTDSGREITERNQSEWEYSRTVIDNLISDRSFDFSQPAPTSVDFKILKKSTSRVPVVRNGEEDDEYDDDEEFAETEKSDGKHDTSSSKLSELPEIEIKPETVTYTEQVVYYEAPAVNTSTEEQQINAAEALNSNSESAETPTSGEDNKTAVTAEQVLEYLQQLSENSALTAAKEQTVESDQVSETSVAETTTVAKESTVKDEAPMDEEQRRIVHENYMRLISEPVAQPKDEVDEVPVADEIDTDKLIYNNKPETERDYRNLINNLFVRTVKQGAYPQPEPVYENNETQYQPQDQVQQQPQTQPYVEPAAVTVKLSDINSKADSDGLKVNTSDYVISTRKKNYNRGATLFKSSLIVGVVLLLEFMFSMIFKDKLGVAGVSLAYPFVIFAIDVAQLLIFGVIYYSDHGKNTRKPSSTAYISACVIVTVILILIVFIVSILLNINFSSAGDIFAKIIIPCLVVLNIPLFAGCFYAFSKYN